MKTYQKAVMVIGALAIGVSVAQARGYRITQDTYPDANGNTTYRIIKDGRRVGRIEQGAYPNSDGNTDIYIRESYPGSLKGYTPYEGFKAYGNELR